MRYLDLKITSGPESISATCPAPKCKAKVHEDAYKQLVEPSMFDKYSNFVIKSFVDDNPLVFLHLSPCLFSRLSSSLLLLPFRLLMDSYRLNGAVLQDVIILFDVIEKIGERL